MVTITEISHLQQLADYKEVWGQLLNESETNVVYLTYEWVLSCWQSFGKGNSLLVLIAQQDDEIVGIAPLSITARKVFGKRILIVGFLSTIWADYNDIIAKEEVKDCVLEAMFSYLFSIKDRWDAIKLDEIPSASSTIFLSERLGKKQFQFCEIRNASVCPRLVVEDHNDEIEKKLLQRKDFKYRHNWFKRQGSLIYKDCESREEILSIINTYFDYHISRWDSTETKSLFYDSKNRDFFLMLVDNMFPAGHLKFSVLSLNGLAVGFCFGFQYNQMVIRYKSTFNNAFRKRSPGLVLLKFMIVEAISKKLYAVDYVRGTEGYKSSISNEQQQNKCIYIYKNNKARRYLTFREGISRSWLLRWLGTKRAYWRFRRIIREYRNRYGYFSSIKILQRLFSSVCCMSKSYLFSITTLPVNNIMANCPHNIRKATVGDIWLVASVYGYGEGSAGRKEIEKAFENGDECFLAFDGKNPSHCSWVRRGRIIGVGLSQLCTLSLSANEACIYHSYTSPVYRGMGIYTAMLLHIQKECFSKGVKKVYICCSAKNNSSVRGIQKAAFSHERKIRIIKLFGKKLFAG